MSDNEEYLPPIPRMQQDTPEDNLAETYPAQPISPIQPVVPIVEETHKPKNPPKKAKKSLLSRLIFWGLSIGFTCLVVGIVTILLLFNHFSKDLPDSSSLANYQPAGMTRLYAANGELIAEYAKERRIFVPYNEIPKKVIYAFVAAEDQNFYTHKGVDPMGILRALLSNLQSYGTGEKSLVGGSTITQQVVKNFLLTPEKSIERKIKEAILALRITQNYSKDRILELYLNEIYLGMRAYGVAAAAKEFFGKDLDALLTEEAALLAAMPKAPAYYDPRKRPEIAFNRRNYVINRMYEDGYINDAEYERAINAPLVVIPTDNTRIATSFFAEEVRRELLEQFGYDNLYKSSLFVKTTQDVRAQKLLDKALRFALVEYDRRHGYRGAIAHLNNLENWQDELKKLVETTPLYDSQKLAVVTELGKDAIIDVMGDAELLGQIIPLAELKWARLVRPSGAIATTPSKASDVLQIGDVVLVSPLEAKNNWRLEQIPKVNGAMIAMRPQTGQVIALSGGYSAMGNQFNRAIQAKRQPGSAFKPFVYLSAFERGFTPSSIVADSPIELSQGVGLPMWRPKNYDGKFLGALTLRTGVEKSRNVMTVRLAQMVGLKRIINLAIRLGIYDELPFNFSAILGAQETTVARLVAAYAMIANGGLKVKPTLVARVDDNIGRMVLRSKGFKCENCTVNSGNGAIEMPKLIDERERVIDPRVAYQMINVLRGVVDRGTATSAKILNMDIGGKTGTTNDSRDAWFVGFSSDIVVGGYIGYDQPQDMGKKETGGRVALPAFISFMRDYYGDNKPARFVKPDGILEVAVDKYSGTTPMPWQESGEMLNEAFVTGGAIYIPGEEIELPQQNADDMQNDQLQQPQYENEPRPAVATDPSQIPNYQPSTSVAPNSTKPSGSNSRDYEYQPSAPRIPRNRPENDDRYNNLPLNHPSRRYQRNIEQYQNDDAGTGGIY